MSTSRAEGSRLAPLNAINQHFRFGFGQFPDFHGFSKAPPPFKNPKISGNRWNQKEKRHFRWNHKFTESHQEIILRRLWLTASIAVKECLGWMLQLIAVKVCLGWYRGILSQRLLWSYGNFLSKPNLVNILVLSTSTSNLVLVFGLQAESMPRLMINRGILSQQSTEAFHRIS